MFDGDPDKMNTGKHFEHVPFQFLNVPYPDDAKILVVVAIVPQWAEPKECSKDELILKETNL